MQSGLPIHTGPVDHLRYGFESLATEAAARHPVDAIQRQVCDRETTIMSCIILIDVCLYINRIMETGI